MNEILKKLVHIYSVTGHESEIADFIIEYFAPLKPAKLTKLNSNSVVVEIKGKDSTKAIIFNGHIDTVSPGDDRLWDTNPLTLEEKDGRLYGLGVSDMKSGVAVLMELANNYITTPPDCDLWFVFAAGEEVDGVGTRDFAQRFHKEISAYEVVNAVVAEPTNLESAGIGHRGNVVFEIDIDGQSGHGSRPHEIKKHAIYDAIEVVMLVNKLSKRWASQYFDDLLGKPTAVVTAIMTENTTSPNKFPASCKLVVDVRTTPALHDVVVKEVKTAVAKTVHGAHVKDIGFSSPPAKCELSEPIVKAMQAINPKLKLDIFPGATDMSFLNAIGVKGIVFGPGDPHYMHVPNESISVETMPRAIAAYKQLVEEFARISNK